MIFISFITLNVSTMNRSLLLLLLALPFISPAQTKALVGGTLIDGYGGKPLQNSVIIIEGERIKAIGTLGSIEISKGAEIMSTYWPSLAMGVEKDFGTVSEGKYADTIAVKGDVLRHINLLQDVKMIVKTI